MTVHNLDEYKANIETGEQFGNQGPPGPPLPPTGGGSNGMEARVARLEADVGHIKTNVADLKIDVRSLVAAVGDLRVDAATTNERVSHLPTKGFIITIVSIGSAAIVGALTLLSHFGFLIAAPK